MSFGDIRVDERAEWLLGRIAATGTTVLRRLGETRAGEMAVHRFLSSPYVSVERIVETLAARTAERCVGRRILVVQDTTEINFTDRDKKRRGFGPAANRTTTGFFIHPVIAVDVESEAVVGSGRCGDLDAPRGTGGQRAQPARRGQGIGALAGRLQECG